MAKIGEDANINSVRFKNQSATPTTTGVGYSHVFVKDDGLYLVDENDNVTGPFGAGDLDIGCRVYRNTNTLIAAGTGVDIPFNAEVYDTDNMHSNTVNPERVTIKTAGKYLIIGSIIWEADITGTKQRIHRIKLNGTTLITYDCVQQDINVDVQPGGTTSAILDLDVDDFITLNAYSSCGNDVDVLSSGDISPFLMLQRF